VHRQPHDVSGDLVELSRTPVAVVCAGAKSILDIPATLEHLETLGVPVLGYKTDDFPAFYLPSCGERVSARVDSAEQAARCLHAHWALQGGGIVLAQPVPAQYALTGEELAAALSAAEHSAEGAGIRGKDVTPYLLKQLAEITEGRTLEANRALVIENARLAAHVALAFAALHAA
jgi:pseudouridine-5'-phosphate glycosidase